jgi:hypothetical protein
MWVIVFMLALLVMIMFEKKHLIEKSNAASWVLTIIVIIAIMMIGGEDMVEGAKVVIGWVR